MFEDSVLPAVYADGRVCISILHNPGDDPHGYEKAAERWSPVHTVQMSFSTRVCTWTMWPKEVLMLAPMSGIALPTVSSPM